MIEKSTSHTYSHNLSTGHPTTSPINTKTAEKNFRIIVKRAPKRIYRTLLESKPGLSIRKTAES